MAKKKQRAKQISKGITHQQPNKYNKLGRKEHMSSGNRRDAQLRAFLDLKNVVLTIPNPNTNETNKKFIKVNAKEVWGSPKK